METNGRLTFGTWTGQPNTITSPLAYNNNQWHHVVATQSGDGMKLYVDGVLVGTNPQTGAQAYTGYWRVGGDTTWGPQPWFAGSLDEVAVYSTALDAQTVANHYALGTTGMLPNQTPDGVLHGDAHRPLGRASTRRARRTRTAPSRPRLDFGDGGAGDGRHDVAHLRGGRHVHGDAHRHRQPGRHRDDVAPRSP